MPTTLTPRRELGPFTIYERVPKSRGLTKYVVGKAGSPDLKDFGKYSTAIRYCKQQLPRPIPHAVLNMEDKSVVSTLPVDYTIIDGEYITSAQAEVDPAKVEQLIEVHGTTVKQNEKVDARGGRAKE